MNEQKKREFFNKVAIESGTNSTDSVRRMYYGMVRAIGKELRSSGRIQLPDLGTFKVVAQKSRKIGNFGNPIVIPETKIVRIDVDYKLKEFVKLL